MFRKAFVLVFFTFIPIILAQNYTTDMGRREAPIFPAVPKNYDINLDLGYKDRYKDLLADFEAPLKTFIDGIKILNKVPFWILDLLDFHIVAAYNKDFAEEVKAMSELLNLPFTEVVILNFVYDVAAQCTSVIVQDEDNNVIHGRGLDFLYAPDLSNLVFHGKYIKNGTLLYEAISIAGFTGLLTGIKPNAYSFSINQYNLLNNATIWDYVIGGIVDIFNVIEGRQSPPLVARIGFETIPDFDGMVEYLKKTKTLSRVFYIVAGTQPGQGVVITKYRSSVQNVTTLDVDAGRWFITQTNYIGNAPDPVFDNRETAAVDWLNSIGRSGITYDALLNQVMAVYPVFNNETIHTTIMQPSAGYFNTTIWGWQP